MLVFLATITFLTACGTEEASEETATGDHTHSYAETWSRDVYQHWHECDCGSKQDAAMHTFDERVCTGCGFVDATLGLQYTLNSSQTEYTLSGNGPTLSAYVYIANYYNGLPVTAIEASTFSGSPSIQTITIPNTVTSIGEGAFANCPSLTSIIVYDDHPVYHTDGNCLIETATKTLLWGDGAVVIPDDGSVTAIGDYAFTASPTLTAIVIPDSVTSIGCAAFANCPRLQTVTMSCNLKSMAEDAFLSCSSKITYGGTTSQWSAIDKGTSWRSFSPRCSVSCLDGYATD